MRDDLTARAVRAACTLRNWAATGHEVELFPNGEPLGETPAIIQSQECGSLNDVFLVVGGCCDLARIPYDYDSQGGSTQATAEALAEIGVLVLELVRRLEAREDPFDAVRAEIPHITATAADAVRHVVLYPPVGNQRGPRWSHVGAALGHGSGVSQALCRACGVDPDEILGSEEDGDDRDEDELAAGDGLQDCWVCGQRLSATESLNDGPGAGMCKACQFDTCPRCGCGEFPCEGGCHRLFIDVDGRAVCSACATEEEAAWARDEVVQSAEEREP